MDRAATSLPEQLLALEACVLVSCEKYTPCVAISALQIPCTNSMSVKKRISSDAMCFLSRAAPWKAELEYCVANKRAFT